MRYFTLEDRYDTKTGKKISPSYTETGIICDFCGKIYTEDPDNDEGHYIMYQIHDYEYKETSYHEDSTKHDIDKYEIMNIHPHFHYCLNVDFHSQCEINLIKTIYYSISEAMYKRRWKVIDKLLDDGLTLEELGYIL